MINTSQKIFSVPQNKPYNRQSTSFGLNIIPHAYTRMCERDIGIIETINTVRSGKKFLSLKDHQERIININYHGNGKVPAGVLVVVTDTTGNTIITALKTALNSFEIIGGKLYHTCELCPPWRKKFSEEIFSQLNILSKNAARKLKRETDTQRLFETPFQRHYNQFI